MDLRRRRFVNKNISVHNLTNQELVFDHSITHSWYNKKKIRGWSKEDVINYHHMVVNEMKRRGMEHKPHDSLDEQAVVTTKSFLEVKSSGMDLGEEITLDEVIRYLGNSFKLASPSISLVGGIVSQKATRSDVDILIETPTGDERLREIIAHRVSRAFPEELRSRLHFVKGGESGAFSSNMPIYDMSFERVNFEDRIYEMAFGEEAQKQAEASKNEDRIELFRFFYPLKTSINAIQAYRQAEVYNVKELIEMWKNMKEPRLILQKKYDGLRMIIFRDQDKVQLVSDNGSDFTSRFPSIITKIKSQPPSNFCLDSEFEMWKGGEHFGREIVSGYANRTETQGLDDSNVVVNVFDCLFFEGEDLHKTSNEERLTYLEKFKFDESTNDVPLPGLNKSPTIYTSTEEELISSSQSIIKTVASEGVMIKSADSVYPLSGASAQIIKYKKYAEVHCIVIDIKETATPGTVNLLLGLGIVEGQNIPKAHIGTVNNRDYVYVGKTMNIKGDFQPGNIVGIRFHTLFHYRGEDGEYVKLYDPEFNEKRVTTESPDTMDLAVQIAGEAGLLEAKTIEKSIDSAYLEFPNEDATYRYVLQTHWRGRGVHGDFRIQLNDETLIGYTLFIAEPGIVDEQVTEYEKAVEWLKHPELFKINFQTAEFKQSAIGVALKGTQPIEWLDVKGVTPWPSEGNIPVGGTAHLPGVFAIVEHGTVEYGSRKEDMAEYFVHGVALNGRYIFKELSMPEQKALAIVNEVSKEGNAMPEDEGTDTYEANWYMLKPEDQTPYVLTKHAVDIDYIPPKGVSALPKEVRDRIPDEYKYWEKENYKEVRNALVANKEVVEHAVGS